MLGLALPTPIATVATTLALVERYVRLNARQFARPESPRSAPREYVTRHPLISQDDVRTGMILPEDRGTYFPFC